MPAEEPVCTKLMGSSVSEKSSPVAGGSLSEEESGLANGERKGVELHRVWWDIKMGPLTGEKLCCAGGIKQLSEEEGCELAGVI